MLLTPVADSQMSFSFGAQESSSSLTIILLISSVIYLARAFKPTLRTFGTAAFNQQRFVQKLRKAVWIYVVLLFIMLWLMVTKPMFW